METGSFSLKPAFIAMMSCSLMCCNNRQSSDMTSGISITYFTNAYQTSGTYFSMGPAAENIGRTNPSSDKGFSEKKDINICEERYISMKRVGIDNLTSEILLQSETGEITVLALRSLNEGESDTTSYANIYFAYTPADQNHALSVCLNNRRKKPCAYFFRMNMTPDDFEKVLPFLKEQSVHNVLPVQNPADMKYRSIQWIATQP